MFSMFDAAAAQQFGKSLADYYAKQMPLNIQGDEKQVFMKQALTIKFMGDKIRAFKEEQSLNIYKKAKAGSAFKGAMLELGYDEKTVDELTIEVTKRLAAA